MTRQRIVLCYPTEPRHLDQIAAVAPDAEIIAAGQQEIPEAILEADIFCGHAKERPVPWDAVVRQGRLQWIQSSAAGMDHCLTRSVIESAITVTSASGLFADQVAEQTMAMLLGLLRSLPTFFRASLKKEFIRRPTADLHGKTVGIIGMGGNGRRLAQVLAPYRVRILATDVFPVQQPAEVDELWPADRLDDVLPQVDVLILCMPLNDETRGMIGALQLAQAETRRDPGQRGAWPGGRRTGAGCRSGIGAPGGSGTGRDRGRTLAGRQPFVGSAQRHYHSACRRPIGDAAG